MVENPALAEIARMENLIYPTQRLEERRGEGREALGHVRIGYHTEASNQALRGIIGGPESVARPIHMILHAVIGVIV